MPPHLYISSDDAGFDTLILHAFKVEGFRTTYLPLLDGDSKSYRAELSHLHDGLELGETYAIIAYGDAASECLSFYSRPQPGCSAVVAYYPTTIPSPKTTYPPHLQVLCHLAASQGFAPAFPNYTYAGVEPGFAESDLDEHDKIAAGLAWTRTLGLVRRAFKLEAAQGEMEQAWETHVAARGISKDPAAALRVMSQKAHVTHVPTLTGGVGQKDLFIFYRDYFISQSPPSMTMRLVSRTIGTDRVVDEVVVSFKHTHEIAWMLPGVPPTGKSVTIAVVSIVGFRGGLLCSEHVYWDQASVLVQLGLLDPKLVPPAMKDKGLEQLPVVGAQGARKVLDEDGVASNELLPSWKDRPKGDPGVKMPARPKPAASGGKE